MKSLLWGMVAVSLIGCGHNEQATIARLQDQLNERQAAIGDRDTEIARLSADNQKLLKQLSAVNAEIDEFKERQREIRERFDAAIQARKEEIAKQSEIDHAGEVFAVIEDADGHPLFKNATFLRHVDGRLVFKTEKGLQSVSVMDVDDSICVKLGIDTTAAVIAQEDREKRLASYRASSIRNAIAKDQRIKEYGQKVAEAQAMQAARALEIEKELAAEWREELKARAAMVDALTPDVIVQNSNAATSY